MSTTGSAAELANNLGIELEPWQQAVLDRHLRGKNERPTVMHPRRAGGIRGFRQRMAHIDEYLGRPSFADPIAGVRNVAAKYIPEQHADAVTNAEGA